MLGLPERYRLNKCCGFLKATRKNSVLVFRS